MSFTDKCNGEPVLPEELTAAVTIGQIQAKHGVRVPGPDAARRDFRLGFVAESHARLLNPTEMTYYEILADDYTQEVPEQATNPHLGYGWAPLTRYFGERTTWASNVFPELKGEVQGLNPAFLFGFCANRNTGQRVPLAVIGSSAWDCRDAGLDMESNDVVDVFFRCLAR